VVSLFSTSCALAELPATHKSKIMISHDRVLIEKDARPFNVPMVPDHGCNKEQLIINLYLERISQNPKITTLVPFTTLHGTRN
jgi:hypothetical protein